MVLALRHHWREIHKIVCLLMAFGIGFYIIFIYAAAYQASVLHFTTGQALEISSVNLAVMLLVVMPVARLSDRVGRRPTLYAAAFSILLFT